MLFWTDLETTGLNPNTDDIIEVAWVLTDDNLEQISEERSFVVAHSDMGKVFSKIHDNSVVREMHLKSGLYDALLDVSVRNQVTLNDVSYKMCDDIKEALEEHESTIPAIAGSSIHFDRGFISYHMPYVSDLLHYRNYDVSMLKTFAGSLGFDIPLPVNKDPHRALADMRNSLDVARAYRTIALQAARSYR